MATRGVIAAGHPVTAEAGAQILKEGGNAFDAAICAVLASFAAESPLTGLGAGGFMLVHTSSGEDHLLDFFVEAGGRGLDPNARADLVAAEVIFDETPQVFNIGPASCGVPGNAAGLWQAAERFASLPFSELARPAVELARGGVSVTAVGAYLLEVLDPIISYYPETRALYAPEGHLLREGEVFRFPELAETLEWFAQEGPSVIYASELTKEVCDWVCERGGFLSVEDFDQYRVVEREPVRARYRGRDVLTNAPPSSGGVLIALALDLLERFGEAGSLDEPAGLARLIEVMDECNRARGSEFEDGLHNPEFVDEFLSPKRIGDAFERVISRLGAAGGGSRDRLGSTTHTSVVDAEGNAVSVTCSNGSCSGVLPAGTGVHLNNMLGEEDLNPLGFHRLPPGTRVTSMMAPTIVVREGEVELALGSAGSNRLRSAILQVIRYVIDYRMGTQEAIDHGRMHYEDGVLHVEPGFEPAALDALERMGYEVVRWGRRNLFFGGAQCVHRDAASGRLSGGGDPRRGGAVTIVS